MFVGFFLYGLIFSLLIALGKVFYLDFLDNSDGLVKILYLLYMAVIGTATIRRLGPINYLECFLVMGVWCIFGILGDILVTAFISGIKVYTTWFLWIGYPTAMIAQLLFHKKVHMIAKKERLGERYNPRKGKFF